MKDLGLEIHQIVGVADGESWSQVRTALPFSSHELKSMGGLLVVMTLSGGEKMVDMGGELMEEIVESFQADSREKKVWLREMVASLTTKIKGNGGVIMGVLVEKEDGRELLVGGFGMGVVCVIERGGKRGKLWDTGTKGIVSGKLMRGDELIVGTQKFWGQVWSKANSKDDLSLMVEDARLTTINLGGGGEVAGVVVRIDEEKLAGGVGVEEEVEKIMVSEKPVIEPEKETVKEKKVVAFPWKGKLRLDSGKKTKMGGLVLSLIAVLLVASIGVGWWQKQKRAENEVYRQVAEPIEHSLEEANQLKDLNPLRARSLMFEVREKMKTQDAFLEGRFANDWRRLQEKVEVSWKQLSGEKQVVGKLWMDLSVIRDEMKAQELTIAYEKLMILDKEDAVIVSIELEDKSGAVIGGGDVLSDAGRMGGSETNLVVLTDQGIVSIDEKKKEAKQVVESEDGWEKTVDVGSYGSNIYLLDNQEIWKYAGSDAGMGSKRRYLGVGVAPDLSQAVDLEIDGEIWVLLSSGKVLRFDRGNEVSFEVKGLDGSWGSIDDLAVGEKSVYILDKLRKRVVVIDKETNEYRMELKWDGFGEAEGMVVEEAKNRLLVGKQREVIEVVW